MGLRGAARAASLFFLVKKASRRLPGRAYSFPTHWYSEEIDAQYAGCSNTLES
jgi:hypothetical protein